MNYENEILDYVQQHPGCTRTDLAIAIAYAGAGTVADRMVRDGKLDRWYTGQVPAYYIPGMYTPPHLGEPETRELIPLAAGLHRDGTIEMAHNCRECGVPLVIGENVTQYGVDHSNYICRDCCAGNARKYRHKHPKLQRERQMEYLHRIGRCQPMSENRECSLFLGVHVAEQVLSHVFKHVERMPHGNPGFDFFCGGGYMVDAKSSCRRHHENWADGWLFHINKNPIAEYFLCLAFDNRESLNPEHVWLIPAHEINHLVGITISETKLDRWAKYEQPIEQVLDCCNIIKETKKHD